MFSIWHGATARKIAPGAGGAGHRPAGHGPSCPAPGDAVPRRAEGVRLPSSPGLPLPPPPPAPVRRVLQLASPDRSTRRNRALGATLAFVAGATNAGGYLAVGQYTSHMTGIVSTLADDIALGRARPALAAIAALLAFILGAMTTAITVNWARRRELQSRFAIPLLLEATLLLLFGLFGSVLGGYTPLAAPATVLLLCYLMGLQNAVITKISSAEIRTTHVTGLITDAGLELGRLVYVNRSDLPETVRANRERLGVHGLLLGCFLAGGLAGALGFKTAGYLAVLPLAGLLLLVGLKPVASDLGEAL